MNIKSGNQKLEKLLARATADLAAQSNASRQLAKLFQGIHDLPSQKELDECYLLEVMRRSANSQVKAAKVMGISPQALCSRLKKSSCDVP